MPPEHEMREDCKNNWHDMNNPKDGVIPCIHKKIALKADDKKVEGKVGMKVFSIFAGVLIAIATVGLTYTYSVEEKTASKVELNEKIAEVHGDIADIKESQRETNNRVHDIQLQMQEDKEELRKEQAADKRDILEAIKGIK